MTGQDGIAMRINGMMKFIINILKATRHFGRFAL